MARWATSLGPPLAAALLLFSGPLASATDVRPTPERIEQLVEELGAGSFAIRQRATRQLIEMGIVARDALLSAASGPDAEVRVRARAVLASVSESDFRLRLEAFSADYEGHQRTTLPGWELFSSQFGTGRASRQFFVDMQRSEPELLDTFTKGGKQLSELLNLRCRATLQQMSHNTNEGPVSLGTIATLLWIGSVEDVEVEEQLAAQFYPWMASHRLFLKYSSSGPTAEMLKKLLGMWIVKDAVPAATAANMQLAAIYELKSVGLAVAGKTLANENALPVARHYAMLATGKFAGKEHLTLVEKNLSDASSCGMVQVHNPPRQVELQLRDVALAVLVQLTGQNPRDYGPALVQPNVQTPFQVGTLAFADPSMREKALKKWAQWRAEHPQP